MKLRRSWKTMTAGVVAIIVATGTFLLPLLDEDPATQPNAEIFLRAIFEVILGLGLLCARDHDVSSEEVRAIHRRRNGIGNGRDSKKIVPMLLLVFLLAGGCSTNGRVSTCLEESFLDPATGETITTRYEAESKAGLMGTIDSTLHQFRYDWGGEENHIVVGQGAVMLDNLGQIEGLALMTELLSAIIPGIVEGVVKAIIETAAIPVPVPAVDPNLRAILDAVP